MVSRDGAAAPSTHVGIPFTVTSGSYVPGRAAGDAATAYSFGLQLPARTESEATLCQMVWPYPSIP